ncbi:17778_t:CDS:2, partial [Gigaspora margarita]
DKETAKQYINEVQDSYTIPRVMLTNYININYTDKPPLPWDPRKIPEVKIKTPITQPKELTEMEIIKEVQPETEVMLPITKYEDIEHTVKILKIKFDTSYIPQNLLQLPELEKHEWNL